MLRKLVLSPVVFAGIALAGVCDNEVNIAAQADIDALSSCTVLSKDVIINADSTLTVIKMDSITNIQGGLSITGSPITSIEMNALAIIGGVMNITALPNVASIAMPNLTGVGGIYLEAIGPSLQELGFNKKVTSVTGDVSISNTYIQDITSINITTVGAFNINNNRYLASISQPLKNATTGINIAGNSHDITVSFPNLGTAGSATFQQCASVDIPLVETITGTLTANNNSFTSFAAPKLTTVGLSITIESNPQLTNLSFPSLTTVSHGDLKIDDNADLLTIDGFPLLYRVEGAVEFIGAFNNISLPSVSDIRGTYTVESTGTVDCGPINAFSGGKAVGQVNCKSTGATSTSGGSGSATSGGSTSTAKSAGVSSATINKSGAIILAAVLGFMAL